jgi:hypothetical protein
MTGDGKAYNGIFVRGRLIRRNLMKKNWIQFIIVSLLLAASWLVYAPVAAAARNAPLVSTEWLAQNVDSPGMVIIDRSKL